MARWTLVPAAAEFLAGSRLPMVAAIDTLPPEGDVYRVIRLADGRSLGVAHGRDAHAAVEAFARRRRLDPEGLWAVEHIPDVSLDQDEAAGTRSSLLGSPVLSEDGTPSTERDAPLEFGPPVRRVIERDGKHEAFIARLSRFQRECPDQVEARRRQRAGIPLIGWPPRRVYEG